MNLLSEDLRCLEKFVARFCRTVLYVFTPNAALVSLVNTLQMCKEIKFQFTLLGISYRALFWSKNYSKLVTSGINGAVYCWSLFGMGTTQINDTSGVSESIIKT
jgi:hypothetical protein